MHVNFTYGSECNHTHFYDMNIILNTVKLLNFKILKAICGDWASSVFGYDCTGMGSYESYIGISEFS